MTMLFKRLALALCLPLGCVFAAQPGEVFQQHQADILAANGGQYEDYVFRAARTAPVTASNTSDTAAKNKSALQATSELLRLLVARKIVWPETLTEAQRQEAVEVLMDQLNVSAKLKGLTRVWQNKESDGRWCSVMAISMASAEAVPALDFAAARAKLLSDDSVLLGKLSVPTLIALRATAASMPIVVERQSWETLLAKAQFSQTRLHRFPALAGRYPLGTVQAEASEAYRSGMVAFSRGDLTEAYGQFLSAAAQTFSFDALNMAGNCARRIGKNPEAVALLLHAAYLKPESSYPWVHLAYVALAEGEKDLCEQCCVAAEQRTPDTWTLQQLELLRKAMLPPPAPAVEVVEAVEETPAPEEVATPAIEEVAIPAPVQEVKQEAPVEIQVEVPVEVETPAPAEPKKRVHVHENVIDVPLF